MPCETPTPCNPCNPVYVETGCLSYPLTGCVIYNGEDIPCLGITKTENLNQILQHLKDVICALGPGGYGEFDFACFASENITTEQQFVEFISATLCEVLGTQVPGSITSLSQLYALIQNLTVQVNLIKNQTVLTCFQTLSGLSTPEDISVLLQAIQTIICDINTRLELLEAGGVQTPITAFNFEKDVNIDVSGLNNHTITANVVRDPDGDNALTTSNVGLMCLSPEITVVDSQSVNLSRSGVHNHTVTADVKISAVAGNAASILADGVYVSEASASETPLVATDSTSINFTTSGTNGHDLTGSIILDPSLLNIAQVTASGLLVSSAALNTPLTPVDSPSIDISVSGLSNHTIEANAIISAIAGNALVVLPDGMYVNVPPVTAGWSLTGNAIISTNFLGSTNNQPLNFKVNNLKSGKITSNGEVAFGYKALESNLSSQVSAFGYYALNANTNGSQNTGLGQNTLRLNTTGSGSTAVGDNSLYNSNGDYNTAVGAASLFKLTIGVGNTGVGYNAGTNYSGGSELIGSYNTFLGMNTINANGFPSISKSTVIGYNAQVTKDNTMVLGGVGADLVSVVVGNTEADDSALLDLVSVEKGFLPPRMTDVQKLAIPSPVAGLTVYVTDAIAVDTSTGVMETYNGATWKKHW